MSGIKPLMKVTSNGDPTIFDGSQRITASMKLKTMLVGDEYVLKDIPVDRIEYKRNFIYVTGFFCKPKRKFTTRRIGNDLYYKRVS